MSFTKGGLSFRRFQVLGTKQFTFGEDHLLRLGQYCFGTARMASASGVETGWLAGDHIRDVDFTPLKNVYPDHLLWELLAQVDRFPPARFKLYYETELKGLAKGNPSGLPSARQKRAAKEYAVNKLTEESKDGRYQRWQQLPCCWDAVTGQLYFSGPPTAFPKLQELFRDSFGAHLFQPENLGDVLRPLDADGLARGIAGEASLEVRPTAFTDAAIDDVAWCVGEGDIRWLGNEFLVWLWSRSRDGDTLRLRDDTEVTYMFSGGLRMECPWGNGGNDTFNHTSAVRMPEFAAAMKAGKLPRKAGLILVRHNHQYALTLDAESFAFSGVKLPKPDAKSTGRAIAEERLDLLRELTQTVDLMYAMFLAVRLNTDAWGAVAKEIRFSIAARKVTA